MDSHLFVVIAKRVDGSLCTYSTYGCSGYAMTPEEVQAKREAVLTEARQASSHPSDLVDVLVDDEAKTFCWEEDWRRFEEKHKWMIRTACPELDLVPVAQRKTVDSLLALARKRIKAAGFKQTCTRCNGTGRVMIHRLESCHPCCGTGTIIPMAAANRREIEKHFAGLRDQFIERHLAAHPAEKE